MEQLTNAAGATQQARFDERDMRHESLVDQTQLAVDEMRYVFDALAKRRQGDVRTRDAIQQVLTESSRFDDSSQVVVRRRADSNIDFLGARLPERQDLALALKWLLESDYPIDGASDHGVSEALYLRDPDGNGVELYRDRPQEEWPRTPEGGLAMVTRPLDVEGLLAELDYEETT